MSKTKARAARRLTATALFGGVGGLELGLARAGHHVGSFCELDPEAATVLARRFPKTALTRDVTRTDEVLAHVDPRSTLLTGGFPCTDLSQAGKTLGFAGGRSSLVRDALQIIEARGFAHVLLENVPNWRLLHRGAYLAEVVAELERLGYSWAYRTLDARAFGSSQRRLRIFLYATLEGDPRDVLFQGNETAPEPAYALDERAHGFYWTEGLRGLGWGEDCVPTLKGGSSVGVPSPPAILLPRPVLHPVDGKLRPVRVITPDIRDAERLQGLPAEWTSFAETIDGGAFRDRRRWLLVGNAVNVDVAAWVGERLARPVRYHGEPGRPLPPGTSWPEAAWGDGRGGRWSAPVSPWPVVMPVEPLADFLQHGGAPLSARATEGFLERLGRSSLRLKPGFVEALQLHLATMQGRSLRAPRRRRASVAAAA